MSISRFAEKYDGFPNTESLYGSVLWPLGGWARRHVSRHCPIWVVLLSLKGGTIWNHRLEIKVEQLFCQGDRQSRLHP